MIRFMQFLEHKHPFHSRGHCKFRTKVRIITAAPRSAYVIVFSTRIIRANSTWGLSNVTSGESSDLRVRSGTEGRE